MSLKISSWDLSFEIIQYLNDQGLIDCYQDEDPEAYNTCWYEVGGNKSSLFVSQRFKNNPIAGIKAGKTFHRTGNVPTPSRRINNALERRFGIRLENGNLHYV